VYGFNPLTPIDLLPIPLLDKVLCKDGFEKASFIKILHHHIKLQIERKVVLIKDDLEALMSPNP